MQQHAPVFLFWGFIPVVPVDDDVADGVKALSYPPHDLKLLERLQCLLLRRQILSYKGMR